MAPLARLAGSFRLACAAGALRSQERRADHGADDDGADLSPRRGDRKRDRQSEHREAGARAVGRQRPRHAEDGQRHHRHRGDLQPVQPAAPQHIAGCGKPVGEQYQRQRRWQGEGDPGGERAEIARAQQADRNSDLAGGRTRQKLAQRDQVGIALLVEPFAALDELVAEIAEMGDGAAERGQAELQEGREHFAGAARWRFIAHVF